VSKIKRYGWLIYHELLMSSRFNLTSEGRYAGVAALPRVTDAVTMASFLTASKEASSSSQLVVGIALGDTQSK
jgi:hypothetical protein